MTQEKDTEKDSLDRDLSNLDYSKAEWGKYAKKMRRRPLIVNGKVIKLGSKMYKITSHIVRSTDCNSYNTLFAGTMMNWVDEAGGIFARTYTGEPLMVTVLFEKFEFHKPVHVGDIVDIYTDSPRIGHTSLTFGLFVKNQQDEHIVSTTCVFVCVDSGMKRTKHLLKKTKE